MHTPKNIVILTGAGISAPSGIPTFRNEDGVWLTHDVADVCTLSGWQRNPALVNQFHDEARRAVQDAQPNAAHSALTSWESVEELRGNAFTVLTQNVDDLHERAGSNTVLHLHGDILRVRCEECGMELRWVIDLTPTGTDPVACPFCGAEALRPAVTWFGEMVPLYDEMDTYLSYADLLVAIGTSGAIYNTAALADMVRAHGGRTVWVNLEAPEDPDAFDEVIVGSAELTVPQLVLAYLKDHVAEPAEGEV